MQVDELDVPGAWLFTPKQHGDDRGLFLEWFKADVVAKATGAPFQLAQANHSVTRRGGVRGIHFATVPPGQAKYLYCPIGALLDVIVDIRVGSPTYLKSTTVQLDDRDRRAVYVAEGLGHGFVALSETASLSYLCSAPYSPSTEFSVNPLDPALGINWQTDAPVLSARDAAAPSVAEAEASGILPRWDDCVAWYQERAKERDEVGDAT